MSTTEEAAVRKRIVVEVPVERAFSAFTEEFDAVKAAGAQHARGRYRRDRLRAARRGRIYGRGVDGSECQWARVLAFEPPNRLVFSWDIGPRWQIESDHDQTSEVEVRFVADGPEPRRA